MGSMPNPPCELGILSNNPAIVERVRALCGEYDYGLELWGDIDGFLESQHHQQLIIASVSGPDGPVEPQELAQIVRHGAKDSYVVCATPTKQSKDAAAFAKKSGCDLVLLEEEILHAVKLEFIASQVVRSRFLPVKPSDLVAGHPLNFDLYHLLPLRQKFLPLLFAGDALDQGKLRKIASVGEVYIERGSAGAFSQFVSQTADRSAAGLEKRCRSRFLALFSEYSRLALQLSSQTENASFGEGQKLLSNCASICAELMAAMAETGEAWRIINNSAIGEIGSVERAPAIAAYAGLFALQMGWEGVDQIMLTALLADIGLFFLPPSTIQRLRDGTIDQATTEEKDGYHKYPRTSLDVLLDRRISIPEKMRQSIVSTHERWDGGGFPAGLAEAKVPLEALLVRFCREFDQRTLLRLGKQRPDPAVCFREATETTPEARACFGSELLGKLSALVTGRE